MKKKKKKKAGIICLIVLLVLVIGIGILLWTQANNLQAIKYAGYSQEERQLLLDQNQERVDTIISSLPIGPLNPLTKEQEEMLQRGEITEKEALQIIMGGAAKKDAQAGGMMAANQGKTGKETATETTGSGSSNLQELVARVYLLRASFTGQLDGLVGQAKSEYIAQKRATGKADKASIASKYISKGLALEGSCDGQMEAILSEITAELERTGGDKSLVSEIRSAYNAEKSVKKANLLSAYAK